MHNHNNINALPSLNLWNNALKIGGLRTVDIMPKCVHKGHN